MFGSNAHYGHRSVLIEYADVAPDQLVGGLVQHGWNYDLGATLVDICLPAPDPFFAWAERNVRLCKAAGLDHVVGLGAPMLYLPPAESPPERRAGSLMAVPVHGWEREKVQQDFDTYAASLAEIAHEFSEITVCLYWYDCQFERNRRPFEALGMRVVTAGHRDNNPGFLRDMRDLLLAHEFVTSNRIQTGVFYAQHVGCKTFLHGPPVGLDGRFDHSGQLFDAWQEREFGPLLWRNFQGDVQSDMAAAELGAAYKRTPEQLRELMLWQPEQGRALAARIQARKVARSSGLGRLWHRCNGWLHGLRDSAPSGTPSQGSST